MIRGDEARGELDELRGQLCDEHRRGLQVDALVLEAHGQSPKRTIHVEARKLLVCQRRNDRGNKMVHLRDGGTQTQHKVTN